MGIQTMRAMDIDRLGKVESRTGPKYLAHWVLKSAQRDRMVLWYCKVLGMELVFENQMVSFMTYDHEHHRLAIIKLPGAARLMLPLARIYRKFYGLDHIAFNFGSLRELLEKYRALKAQEILPVWCINHGPTTSIYYEDPDGNRLEFQSDNFDTAEDFQKFAIGLDFNRNPIGVNFDPDLLWQKLESGLPLKDLRQRGSATPAGKKPIAGLRTINWRTL